MPLAPRSSLPLPKHGHPAVHRLPWGVLQRSTGLVALVADNFHAERFQRTQREPVLDIEIAGDDQHAVRAQFSDALIENFLPELLTVPKVLMTEKHDIEIVTKLLVATDLGSILDQEFGWKLLVRLPCLANLANSDVSSHHFHRATLREVLPHFDEGFRLVTPAAGQIQDPHVLPSHRQMRRQ